MPQTGSTPHTRNEVTNATHPVSVRYLRVDGISPFAVRTNQTPERELLVMCDLGPGPRCYLVSYAIPLSRMHTASEGQADDALVSWESRNASGRL